MATFGTFTPATISIDQGYFLGRDFGDAPDTAAGTGTNNYNTLDADNGVWHNVFVHTPHYVSSPNGAEPDVEPDGQPNLAATGDDTGGVDDENGLISGTNFQIGDTAEFTLGFAARAAGDIYFSAWFDANRNGVFEASEKDGGIFTAPGQGYGTVTYDFGTIPASAAGLSTYARFRIDADQGSVVNPTGYGEGGEVEDYRIDFMSQQNDPELDFGDAPVIKQGIGYATLSADDGPRHFIPEKTVYFGEDEADRPDPESDGQPTVPADGDDMDGNDDEGGIDSGLEFQAGDPLVFKIPVTTEIGADAFASAWIDFDQSLTFDLGERVSTTIAFSGSATELATFDFGTVPSLSSDAQLYMRLRVSSDPAEVEKPTGGAQDGEVEDHVIKILADEQDALDFGDAPDLDNGTGPGDYQTRLADDGARHIITASGPYFGSVDPTGATDAPDADPDGQPNTPSTGDDIDGNDDEDGLVSSTIFQSGDPLLVDMEVTNQTGADAYVYGWLDLDQDGVWSAAEQAATLVSGVGTTTVTLNFGTAPGVTSTQPIYGRFRISEDKVSAELPTGEAPDGEVEDHLFTLRPAPEPELDFGDAPKSYQTFLADDGPRHVVTDAGPWFTPGFGASFYDAEPDGIPSADADGDDMTGFDDEDGVLSALTGAGEIQLVSGDPVDIALGVIDTTGAGAFVSGWIDFNMDGDFDDPGEMATGVLPATGGAFWDVVKLSFDAAPIVCAEPQITYARFRVSSDPAAVMDPFGFADDGEVEDWVVSIEAAPGVTITGTAAGEPITGGAGADSLSGLAGDDTIRGQACNDTIDGGGGNDLISGGDGNDDIVGGSGNDTIDGGAGNDLIDGGTGIDAIDGGAGNDTIDASFGSDATVSGGDGSDRVFGGGGNDVLEGNDGNDFLQGGSNLDTLFGGLGNDTLVGEIGRDSLEGGDGDDLILGGNAPDTMRGGAGDDIMRGQGQEDTMFGDSGNDDMQGGASLDRMWGGTGNDTMDGGAFNDEVYGEAGSDIVLGASGNDLLDGGADNDSVGGGSGDDTVSGGSGNDFVQGGIGSDIVNGNDGSDTLDGGNANDTLDGGAGVDKVFGGSGSDLIFVFAGEGGDVITAGTGLDVIDLETGFVTAELTDFSSGQDQIDVVDIAGVTSFADITVSVAGSDTTLDFGGGDTMLLSGYAGPITAADFIF